ncbi:hypothetical protein ACJMK2_014472 [Sinanodonta woodiana]
MTAEQIAGEYGYTDVQKVLSEHNTNFEVVDEEIDTFQPWHIDIERKGFGLIPITLAAYKNTFHPKMIDPRKSIVSVLRDIFNDLNTSPTRWIEVRDKISDSIYVVCAKSAETVKECSYREGFYKQIIYAYTEEATYLYTYMNTALRRQRECDYKPSAIDLAMGPYVVMYQMLLLFWDDLSRDNTKTYRQMKLNENDLEKYQVGVQFIWLAFVSSSVNPEKAKSFPTYTGATGENTTTFIIDNTAKSSYQPRDIEHYARYPENERVYPAGAKFEVTKRSRKGASISVELKLLSS